jgi:predicted DNA-binding WGR domain protein
MADIAVTGWYLQNTLDNHYKDYAVYLADNGVLAIRWGRIDTQGQCKVTRYPTLTDAKAVALRQVYAKAAKGYKLIDDEIKFSLDEEILKTAASLGTVNAITRAFADAKNRGRYEGDKVAVFTHYDKLTEVAEALMTRAASAESFDALEGEFNAMEAAWTALEEKRAQVEITIGLTRQMLMQKLLTG